MVNNMYNIIKYYIQLICIKLILKPIYFTIFLICCNILIQLPWIFDITVLPNMINKIDFDNGFNFIKDNIFTDVNLEEINELPHRISLLFQNDGMKQKYGSIILDNKPFISAFYHNIIDPHYIQKFLDTLNFIHIFDKYENPALRFKSIIYMYIDYLEKEQYFYYNKYITPENLDYIIYAITEQLTNRYSNSPDFFIRYSQFNDEDSIKHFLYNNIKWVITYCKTEDYFLKSYDIVHDTYIYQVIKRPGYHFGLNMDYIVDCLKQHVSITISLDATTLKIADFQDRVKQLWQDITNFHNIEQDFYTSARDPNTIITPGVYRFMKNMRQQHDEKTYKDLSDLFMSTININFYRDNPDNIIVIYFLFVIKITITI